MHFRGELSTVPLQRVKIALQRISLHSPTEKMKILVVFTQKIKSYPQKKRLIHTEILKTVRRAITPFYFCG